jgi:polysaccharide chain length determinant protein (PEP-CTERM system associated)
MSDAQEWSLSRVSGILRRRRRVLAWTAVATMAAVAAFVIGLPNVYRASATLIVQGQVPDVVVQAPTQAVIEGRLQTIKQEALSRARLTDLLTRFDLYGVSSGRTRLDAALMRLQHDIRVEPTSTDPTGNSGPQTIAFRVSYIGTNPQTSADVANALAAFFVAQNDQMRAAQASRAVESLGAQVAETRARLEGQEARLRAYSAKNLGALPQQTEANLAAINRLDAQMRLNDTEESKLIERRQSLQHDLAALDTQVPAENDTTPQAQLGRLERELADARMKFGDTYPDVKAARDRLEAFRRAMPAMVAAAGPAGQTRRAVLQSALKEVESRLNEIGSDDRAAQAQINQYQSRVERAPASAPAFDGLVRDYQATRDVLDGLQKRYAEAQLADRVESRADTQEFRLLDVALPPAATAGPSRLLLCLLGIVGGIVLGLAAAMGVDATDTSFHSVDDLRHYTIVPVLASIPLMEEPVSVWHRTRVMAEAAAAILVIGGIAEGAFLLARQSDQVSRLLSRVM